MLSFIKKIDQKLLKTKPAFWSSRIVYVLFFTLAFGLLVGLISRAILPDPRSDEEMVTPTFFVAVLCGIGIVIWMIFLLRFNVFKKFATKNRFQFLAQFGFFFLCFICIVATAYIPTLIEWKVANNKFPSVKVAADVNFVNDAITQLEAERLKLELRIEYFKVDSSLKENEGDLPVPSEYEVVADRDMTKAADAPTKNDLGSIDNPYLISPAAFEQRKKIADSIEIVAPLTFRQYSYPDCNFFNFYDAGDDFEVLITPSNDFTNKYLWNIKPVSDTLALQNQVLARLEKYAFYPNSKAAVKSIYYPRKDQTDQNWGFSAKYRIDEVQNEINDVLSKKNYYSVESLPWQLRVAFYISFVLSILLLIFRHSNVKTFFLSILTAIVLLIVTGVFVALTRAESVAIGVVGIVYYILFAAFCVSIFNAKKQLKWQGIALNIFTFFLPFLPMWCVFSYVEYRRELLGYKAFEESYLGKHEGEIMQYAEICGILLFLILLHFLLRKLYRKWYSLPND